MQKDLRHRQGLMGPNLGKSVQCKCINCLQVILKLWFCHHNLRSVITNSATRFDETLPLQQSFHSPRQFRKDLFYVQQNFEPYLAILLCYWKNFRCCKRPIIELIIQPSGHIDYQRQCTYHWSRRQVGMGTRQQHIQFG